MTRDYRDKNLRGMDYRDRDLRHADFSGACLQHARFDRTDLTDFEISQTNRDRGIWDGTRLAKQATVAT